MKKYLFILFSFIAINLNSQNTLQNVAKTVSNVVDSTKIATLTAINTTDTSSNFKMIYQDVKEGLTGLAQGLKVGAEHVYIVLVKQQIVNSITWTIIYLITILLWYLLIKNWTTVGENSDYISNIFGCVFGGILTILMLVFTLNSTVMGYINPEYGAIKDIINFVQNTSNTCSTCK